MSDVPTIPEPTPDDYKLNLEHAWNCSELTAPPEAFRQIIRLLAAERAKVEKMRAAAERAVAKYQDHTCITPACECEACQLAAAIRQSVR